MGFLSSITGDGLLGLAGNVLGGVLGWKAQGDTNESNVDLWREQAEYNKPVNQVKRWREAGLNPNLIYGQGTSGNIQNLPKQEAPSFNMDFMRTIMMSEQAKNLKEQNKNLQAQNAKVKADTAAQNLQNEITANRIEVAKRNGLPYDLPITLTTLADLVTGQSQFLAPELLQKVPLLTLFQNLGTAIGTLRGAPLVEKYRNYKTPYKQLKEQRQYFQSRYQ